MIIYVLWEKMQDISRRVYSEEGISPSIHTCQGGNTEPKVEQEVSSTKNDGGHLIKVGDNEKEITKFPSIIQKMRR